MLPALGAASLGRWGFLHRRYCCCGVLGHAIGKYGTWCISHDRADLSPQRWLWLWARCHACICPLCLDAVSNCLLRRSEGRRCCLLLCFRRSGVRWVLAAVPGSGLECVLSVHPYTYLKCAYRGLLAFALIRACPTQRLSLYNSVSWIHTVEHNIQETPLLAVKPNPCAPLSTRYMNQHK